MSACRRMIGRELPCNVLHILELAEVACDPQRYQQLVERAELGLADAESLYQFGRWHLAKEQLGLARKRLLESLAKRHGFVAARLTLAGVCDLLGQHEEAANHIDLVVAQMVTADAYATERWSRYALLCAAGFCLERSGQWQQARSRYGMALAARPGDLFALHRLVALHLAHDEPAEAIDCLRLILKSQPQDQTARVCLGHLLQKTSQSAEAIWEYEQALCLEPDSWELPLETARALQSMENSDEAIGLLEKLVGAQPHFPDLRMRLGNLYSRRGDDEMARAQYGKALLLHSEYLDCHIALARHELGMGRKGEAVQHFQRAIAINDQNVEACAGLGLALRRAGLRKRSAEMLASAGRIGNNSAVLMAQLAIIEAEDWAEAGTELHLQWVLEQIERDAAATDAHPSWTEVRMRRGMLLWLIGRHEEAEELMREQVRREPACSEAWLQLGLLLAERSRAGKAADAIGKGLIPDGRTAELEYRIGLIYCGELEFDLATELAEESGARPAEVQRRVWGVIDGLQLGGLRRAARKAEAAESQRLTRI